MFVFVYLFSLSFSVTIIAQKQCAGPILDSEVMGVFFGASILGKKGILLASTPKQVPYLTISNKNIFFKTKGTRLGVIVAPNKCLE